MSVRSSILAAAAVAATTLNFGVCAGPAVAQTFDTVVISYADLNLASTAGRQALDRRIAGAAATLCGDQFTIMELRRRALSLDCQEDVIAAAQPQRDAAVGLRGTVRISSADRVMRVSRAAN